MEDAERLPSAYLIDDRAKIAHTLAPPSTSIGRDASNEDAAVCVHRIVNRLQPLPFDVPTVAEIAAEDRLGELDVLYWVGCAAAFDPRNQKVARAVATCLHAAGVRFAVLGQEESCTGDPARRMGNDYVFQMLAMGNVETLNRYKPRLR